MSDVADICQVPQPDIKSQAKPPSSAFFILTQPEKMCINTHYGQPKNYQDPQTEWLARSGKSGFPFSISASR